MKDNDETLKLQIQQKPCTCNTYKKNNSTLVKYILMLLLLSGILFLDIYTKQLAQTNLKGKQPVYLINNFLEVGYSENRGMVFGILNNTGSKVFRTVFTGFRVIILLFVTIFIFMSRKGPFRLLFPFYLIWAGAAGNLIDTFCFGYVIDFIHIHLGSFFDWPFFFNLADAYLCVAMAILLIGGMIPVKKTNSNFLFYPEKAKTPAV